MTRNEVFLKLKNCWSYRHDGTAHINEERIKDVIDHSYNDHEAQLKAKDEDLKLAMDLSEHMLDELKTERGIKEYLAKELKAKNEEIAKYQMAIDKQSKRAEALGR